MLTSLRKRIEEVANLRIVVLLFIGLLPFNLIFFPARSERLEGYLGYRANVLDAYIYYSPDYANQYMSDLGLSGRQFYAVSQLTLDVLYPLLYGLLLSLSLALIYKNGLKTEHFLLWPPALPFTGTLADLCENFMIAFMLLTYPILSNWLVYVANLFTVVKWFAVTLSFMLIIFGAGRYFLTNLIHTRRK